MRGFAREAVIRAVPEREFPMRLSARARALAVGISAVLVAGLLSVGSPALAAGDGAGSVSGSVTFPAGLHASDGSTAVNLYTEEGGDPVASDDVEADGTYRVIGLQPGTYRLQVTSDIPTVSDVWWRAANSYASAADIIVAEADVPGIDVDLGASISGTVIGGYVAYGDGEVIAYRLDEATGEWLIENGSAVTTNGAYAIAGLRAGTYTLSFTDYAWAGEDEDGNVYSSWKEWWRDQPGESTATRFVVPAGADLTGYNADLNTVGGKSSWPTTSGVAQVGRTLTASAGAWSAGTALEYQWYAGDEPINGATRSTLVLTTAQLNLPIFVQVWGRTGPRSYEGKESDWTDEVIASFTLTTAAPTISGALASGSTVTAKPGAWTAGTTFSYQWYANGRAVTGATAATFTIGTAQRGAALSVKVTGKKAGYLTASRTSGTTAKVATAATPTVAGRASVGSTLTAKPGTWTAGTALSYRWYADGVAIANATRATFTITNKQVGKGITVTITGRKSGYATVAKSSKATLRVPRVGTPTVAGRAYATVTLTAKPGTWSSGTAYTYQWYSNGRALTNATKSTLTLNNGHIGKRITVKVTGRKSGYTTVSKTSAATAVAKTGTSRPATRDNCPSAYPVKGNQTTRHTADWIYHVPGGRYYAATDPEQCFVTPRAAERAGYRASQQ